MSFRLQSRLGRLEHAVAFTLARQSFKLRLGHLKQLPGDYAGEKHIEIVKQLPPRSPIGEWVEFEERPGPSPKPPEERIINVCFVGGKGDDEGDRPASVQT
jgi:hypothetical protein